jgi:rhodanese-related sulfurtransferase
LEIFKGYDLVIDGSDNFQTRYLVNDACVLSDIQYVYGSIYRFSGQVSVFADKDGPCYRCLYPDPPAPDSIPNCNEDGVLGVLPGVIGTLMATEAIKVLLKIGTTLSGRLLTYDALGMKFKEYQVAKYIHCPVCSENPTITELVDYEEFCNGKELGENITVEEYASFRTKRDHLLLDVREQYEFDIANIGGLLIPLAELSNRLGEIQKEKEVVVLCHHGVRSMHGLKILKANGFPNVRNLRGGIKAWSERIDSSVPKY